MQATIMMTYRAGATPDRYLNLLSTLQRLAQHPNHEVIVVEQDVLPTISECLPHPNCRVLFAYNPGPFNKAWGLNIAVRAAKFPLFVFTDADLLPPAKLDQYISSFQSGYAFIKPYRRVIDLTPEQTLAARAGTLDLASLQSMPQDRSGIGEHLVLCGGMFMIRHNAFTHVGGWDERFVGWGGEDDALSYTVQRARLSTLEYDEQPALHLWHPRSTTALGEDPNYLNNCRLNARYRLYNDAELKRWSEVNRQVMGHSKKYEPAHG
ncbi:MAG: glycosyltransferase [Cupriavidus sp.]|nr:MAG: glycosyltransferase [Cupriavidus sp.]